MRLNLKVKAATAITSLFLGMMALLAAIQTGFIRADLMAQVGAQQSVLVNRVARDLDQKLSLNLEALAAQARAIPEAIQGHPEEYSAYLAQQPALLLLFDSLLVFSPTGEIIADAPRLPGRQGIAVADREYFQRSIATRRPLISEPYLGRAANRPNVMMMAPILDRNGRLLGFLGGVLDLLEPNLLGSLATTSIGSAGYFFVVTRSAPSVYVVHPDHRLILTSSKSALPGAAAPHHEPTTHEGVDASGVPSLFSYESLTTASWLLATSYPMAEALAPVVAAERRQWLISGAFAALLAPLVWLLAWYFIAPLLRLHDDVRRLHGSSGAISPALQARQDEIGDLAREFATLVVERERQADALLRSAQLLDNIVDNMPVAIQLKNVEDDLRFEMWNKAAEAMYGLPKERVIGRTVHETWSADDIARYRESDLLAVASNGLDFPRRASVTAHGGVTLTHMRKLPLYNARGVATHLLVISENVTERVAAEEKLADSEARFRGAAESALDAFFVLDSVHDAANAICDFRLRYLNTNAERLLSRSAADAVGQLLCDMVPAMRTDGRFEKLVAVVETHNSLDEEYRATGTGFDADWLHHQIVRLGDGIAITSRDISARKVAEAELQSNRAFLSSLIENLPVAISVKDVRPEHFGRIVVWNKGAEYIGGIAEAEALGHKDSELFAPDVYREIEAHDRTLLANPTVTATPEHPFLRRDGTLLFLRTTSVPIFGPDATAHFILRISEDVTARRKAEHALHSSEHRMRTITDTLPAWIAYIDRSEVYQFTNAALERAFEVKREAFRGRAIRDVVGGDVYRHIQPYVRQALAGVPVTFEREQQIHGEARWVETTYIPETHEVTGEVVGFHAMLQDVTSKKVEEQRLLRLSQVDSLTGLVNRVGFEQRLADAMASSRTTGEAMAVMYLDIDRFKAINDTRGHAAGDALLTAFAARLRATLRRTDVVARLGGDEFVVIMERVPDVRIAATVAKKTLHEILQPFALGNGVGPLAISASIGIAFFDGGPMTAGQLVANADAMLYEAKHAGRNGYRIATWPLWDRAEVGIPH